LNKKLYVGNIDYDATDETLKELFSQAGEVVSANVLTDRQTGRSRGFGFVEMASEEEAKQAIDMFDGTEQGGRTIKVDEARPRKDNDNSGSFGA